jgi:acyl-coenzyme A synthetase/AMP-(fatty) acid ligase
VSGRLQDVALVDGHEIPAKAIEQAVRSTYPLSDIAVLVDSSRRQIAIVATSVGPVGPRTTDLERAARAVVKMPNVELFTVVLEKLPKNRAGKVDRRELRRLLGAPWSELPTQE